MTGDDQPQPEVADAILAAPTTTLAGEPSVPQSADDGERGDESSGSGDGTVVRNFRFTTDPALLVTFRKHPHRLHPSGLHRREFVFHD